MQNKKLLQKIAIGAATIGTIGSFATLVMAADTTTQTTQIQNQTTQNQGKHKAFGHHKNQNNLTQAQKDQMKAQRVAMGAIMKALQTGDYAAFHTAVAGNTKAEAITADQFNTIIQGQKIMQDAGLMPQMGKKGFGGKSDQ
jgi:putative salt-induced outer membrane protein YdiY